MALTQNQFAMSTLVGTKLSGSNLISAEFYSATGTDTIVPGEMVILSTTTNGACIKVAKGAGLTAAYIGVVVTDVVKDSFAVGDKIVVALFSSIVYMTASAAIATGAVLQYATATGKVVANASVGTNTTVGRALEAASADGDILRVMITCV